MRKRLTAWLLALVMALTLVGCGDDVTVIGVTTGGDQTQQQEQQGYHHKCAVCGKTDTDYPDMQFRYCSKCAGYHCFCQDHIFNHVHFTEE